MLQKVKSNLKLPVNTKVVIWIPIRLCKCIRTQGNMWHVKRAAGFRNIRGELLKYETTITIPDTPQSLPKRNKLGILEETKCKNVTW